MRYGLPLMIIIALLALSIIPTTSCISSDAAESAYHVEGYVIYAEESRQPLENVEVAITIGTSTFTDLTDEKGYFIVDISSNTNTRIRFTLEGYALLSCPYTEYINSNMYELDLASAPYNSSTSTYTITSDPAGSQCATMVRSVGVLTVHVIYDDGNVNGANVKVTSTVSQSSYSGKTNSEGMCSIQCSTGTYTMTITRDGFHSEEVRDVTITTGTDYLEVSLNQNNTNDLFGMDLAHILMMIGVCVGIILAMIAWFVSRRLSEGDNQNVEIIDDSVQENEDEENFRYS